jgi:hypothetical protein
MQQAPVNQIARVMNLPPGNHSKVDVAM